MEISIKRNKSKSKLKDLMKKINDLHGKKAEIGYFKENGIHKDSNLLYASLYGIHHEGAPFNHPVRQVFPHIKPNLKEASGAKQTEFYLGLFKTYFKDSNLDNLLDSIGSHYQVKAWNVFGNTSYLVTTKNPTPLVKEGHLKDNFSYRTTINMTLRNKA